MIEGSGEGEEDGANGNIRSGQIVLSLSGMKEIRKVNQENKQERRREGEGETEREREDEE